MINGRLAIHYTSPDGVYWEKVVLPAMIVNGLAIGVDRRGSNPLNMLIILPCLAWSCLVHDVVHRCVTYWLWKVSLLFRHTNPTTNQRI